MLKETTPVAPYIFVLANMQYMTSPDNANQIGFNIPTGIGLNFRIVEDMSLNLSGGYAFGASEKTQDHLFYNAGFMFDLGGESKDEEEKPIVEVVPEPLDTDGDGIIDDEDECPEVYGLAEFAGCPDTDGDGIIDNSDKCPELAGLAEFDGCPDTDGDGIPDHSDDCPEVAGVARLKGCPEPDRDGDGVIDIEDDCPDVPGLAIHKGCPDTDGDGIEDRLDKCPTEPGPLSNKGCPEIKEEVKARLDFAANAIQFETGSALIKTSSFKILDEVAEILKEWSQYSVSVEGHTDNVGSAESNLILSEKRAAAAATYLINKGIDAKRVKSVGFGLTKPIADNSTVQGRNKNRRVEFNLYIAD
jgi:outer membrane protein OmpA-like peptidoglycan-associated protein